MGLVQDVCTELIYFSGIVCGPSSLAEDVRSALASDIAGPMGVLRGRAPVTLHVEKFEMAVSDIDARAYSISDGLFPQ